jgi:hypothetical protein
MIELSSQHMDLHHFMLCRSKQDRHSIPTPPIYQNPFMAPNNFSEIHDDAYQTDTQSITGPGRSKHTATQGAILNPPTGIAASLAFNSSGQILTTRVFVGPNSETLTDILLIEPQTLQVIAKTSLPSRPPSPSGVSFSGGYFFLDALDRVVCVTSNQQIRIYAVQANQFVLTQTYDLNSILNNPEDELNSVLPDNIGNLWFISKQAIIGYIDPNNGQIFSKNIRTLSKADPKETHANSFAIDESGGIYTITDFALYRFQIGSDGIPEATWRTPYDRGTRQKPGQVSHGSGTTPTLFNDFQGNRFVTIADNADPFMHVLVYNRDNGGLIAKQKVFTKLPHKNSTENSLIAVNHSIIIENNYGNIDVESTAGNKTTKPGLARVDFTPDGHSEVVWENYNISIPSVVTKLSTKDGLIYTYAKDHKSWYFAAADFQSGKIISKKRISSSNVLKGSLANNFYSGLNIGPDQSVYIGVIGGIAVWRPHHE